MKHLFLVRHAKSTRDMEFIQDIDRPLTERGYRDAIKVSTIIKAEKINNNFLFFFMIYYQIRTKIRNLMTNLRLSSLLNKYC